MNHSKAKWRGSKDRKKIPHFCVTEWIDEIFIFTEILWGFSNVATNYKSVEDTPEKEELIYCPGFPQKDPYLFSYLLTVLIS